MKFVGLQTSEGWTDIRIDDISAVRYHVTTCMLLVSGRWIEVYDTGHNVKDAIEHAESTPPAMTKERLRAVLDKALEASGAIYTLPQIVLEEIERELGL